MVYKVIVRHNDDNSETLVNNVPKYNCQHHLSSNLRKWQNSFQQNVDIVLKKMKDKMGRFFKTLDLIYRDVVKRLNVLIDLCLSPTFVS